MRVRQRKVIENDVLHSWLVDQLIQSYGPGLDVRNFGCDDVHAVKLLKFLKLQPDGTLLVSIADSVNSAVAILTSRCISQFEREQRCRITEYTTNTVVLISEITLKWLPLRKFQPLFGHFVPFKCHSYGILVIDRLEVLDSHQQPVGTTLESAYQNERYNAAVKPFQFEDVLID